MFNKIFHSFFEDTYLVTNYVVNCVQIQVMYIYYKHMYV